MRRLKIWEKLGIFVLVLIIVTVLIMNLFLEKEKQTSSAYQKILENVVLLNDATERLNEVLDELELYLSQSSTRNVDHLNAKMDSLYATVNAMPTVFATQTEQMAYNDIRNMLISLSQCANASIKACRGRDIEKMSEEFARANSIASSVAGSINFLVFEYMTESKATYEQLVADSAAMRYATVMILAVIILLISAATILILRNLTKPLSLLTEQAAVIAQYPEDEHQIDIASDDEVGDLAAAFNKMSKQIRRYIARLNEKANLENELRNSELKNLNTQNMLRDAELKALQSQINPHFLFNTLNCIAQTAMFEDAAETNSLIITVSNMLRYNLRRLETPVTLGEEITNLNRYICIQKLRYGDRIHFETDIDEDTLSVQIPCLTIQPIVENAVIHGFESNECGGTIRVDAHRTSAGELLICVEDDGIGMDAQRSVNFSAQAKRPKIAAATPPASASKTSSIGCSCFTARTSLKLPALPDTGPLSGSESRLTNYKLPERKCNVCTVYLLQTTNRSLAKQSVCWWTSMFRRSRRFLRPIPAGQPLSLPPMCIPT